MPSPKHEERLCKAIDKYKNQGFRVIRLDKRTVPDAILIKDNLVFALEIDTESHYAAHQSSLGKHKNWDEFDEVWISIPKMKGHTIEEYERALKMHNKGTNLFKISKEMKIPYSVLWDWVHKQAKPAIVKHSQYSKKEVIIYEQ